MANRSTLAKSKLDEFGIFIERMGYELGKPNRMGCEVMRFKIPGSPMGIIFQGKSTMHYSVNNAAYPFVRKFIRSKSK